MSDAPDCWVVGYTVSCLTCGPQQSDVGARTFVTVEDRDEWARGHYEATGHPEYQSTKYVAGPPISLQDELGLDPMLGDISRFVEDRQTDA